MLQSRTHEPSSTGKTTPSSPPDDPSPIQITPKFDPYDLFARCCTCVDSLGFLASPPASPSLPRRCALSDPAPPEPGPDDDEELAGAGGAGVDNGDATEGGRETAASAAPPPPPGATAAATASSAAATAGLAGAAPAGLPTAAAGRSAPLISSFGRAAVAQPPAPAAVRPPADAAPSTGEGGSEGSRGELPSRWIPVCGEGRPLLAAAVAAPASKPSPWR